MSKTDDSVGLRVSWSLSGFSVKIKSRLLSSADRLGAYKIDHEGLETERKVAIYRALTESQVSLVRVATKTLASELENDPDRAERALRLFASLSTKADNLDSSFGLALEDLRTRADATIEEDGPNEINPDLLSRWQHYAEGANSEQLRERWGKILAAEIRRPGAFSIKAMRIIDEIDTETAHIFEVFCKKSLFGWVPYISAKLTDREKTLLEEADLIYADEFPRTIKFDVAPDSNDAKWWMLAGKTHGVMVRRDSIPPKISHSELKMDDVRVKGDELVLNVLELTSVGRILSDLVDFSEDISFRILFDDLRLYWDPSQVKYLKRIGKTKFVEVGGAEQKHHS